MTVRDAGLLALGFVAGWAIATMGMVAAAQNVAQTDQFMRALRLKFGTRTQGQG